MVEEKEDVCNSGRSNSSSSFGWVFNWLVVLAACGLLIGCTTIKKAGVTAIAAGGGATAATVLSSGVAAPIVGGMTGAFVGSVGTNLMSPSSKANGMTDCANDNFWTLLGSLVEMGGWFLLLLIFVPMVLGWVLPGPLERKKKKD